MTEIIFTWGDFENAVGVIIHKLEEQDLLTRIRYVCGVPRGGLVLAVVLSNRLNKPLRIKMDGWRVEHDVLMVDDISDSGKTLAGWDPPLSATIHIVKGTIFMPTIHVLEKKKGDWIKYPWE